MHSESKLETQKSVSLILDNMVRVSLKKDGGITQ